MTREEAIEVLENGGWWDLLIPITTIEGRIEEDKLHEALDLALTALCPLSREKVEKVWKGEWVGSADGYADGELVYDTWTCSECGHVIDEEDDPDMLPQFCPKCYAAMTDEAVDMGANGCENLTSKDAINFGISDAPTYIKATVDQYIDEAPTIDAVPVVRCRECRHYKPEEYFSPCTLPQGLECAKPDDFCSYGQRKEADHD